MPVRALARRARARKQPHQVAPDFVVADIRPLDGDYRRCLGWWARVYRLGFRNTGLGMENGMEKKVANEMEAGIIQLVYKVAMV